MENKFESIIMRETVGLDFSDKLAVKNLTNDEYFYETFKMGDVKNYIVDQVMSNYSSDLDIKYSKDYELNDYYSGVFNVNLKNPPSPKYDNFSILFEIFSDDPDTDDVSGCGAYAELLSINKEDSRDILPRLADEYKDNKEISRQIRCLTGEDGRGLYNIQSLNSMSELILEMISDTVELLFNISKNN